MPRGLSRMLSADVHLWCENCGWSWTGDPKRALGKAKEHLDVRPDCTEDDLESEPARGGGRG